MKKPTDSSLKKKLWIIFSKYIRLRDRNRCFTCDGIGNQAGHFIPRSAGGVALYFHEDNVHAQCSKCNLHMQGNVYEYGKRLGEKKVQELMKIKQQITKNFPYQEKIEYYQKKLEELE